MIVVMGMANWLRTAASGGFPGKTNGVLFAEQKQGHTARGSRNQKQNQNHKS
jgi:hypothetical protein